MTKPKTDKSLSEILVEQEIQRLEENEAEIIRLKKQMKPKTDNTSMGNPPTGTYFEKPKPQTKGWEEKLDKYGCCSGDYCSGDHNAKLAGFIRRIENQAYKRGREDEAIECQKDMERVVEETKREVMKGIKVNQKEIEPITNLSKKQ